MAASKAAWVMAERNWHNLAINPRAVAKQLELPIFELYAEVKRRGWPSRAALNAAAKAARSAASPKLSKGKPAGRTPQKKSLVTAPRKSAPPSLAGAGIRSGDEAKDKGAVTVASKVKKRAAPKPIALVLRVFRTIDGELSKLADQEGTTSQDRERASRALSQIVNSLEKAEKMQREIAKEQAKGSATNTKEELIHAEDLRRQIAERIERLQNKWTNADGPDASEPS